MKRQDYSNHKRYIALFHFLMFGLVICIFGGAVLNYINSINKEDEFYSSLLILGIGVVQLMSFFFFRGFALRAQDRAIRAEENFRHFILSGKPFDTRLNMDQIVALRFAPDDEFILLSKEAVEKQLTGEEIKKSIKRWKGDYHRV